MGAQENGKVIPFSPRLREADGTPPRGLDNRQELSLSRRRGLDSVDAALPAASPEPPARALQAPAPAPKHSLDAPALSRIFIESLDDMICRTPCKQSAPTPWPHQRDQQLEKTAVDIIDMLFGFVLDDSHVSRAIKDSLLRAQMPMLQLAMRESTFFADWQHPARTLLNDIAPMCQHLCERGGDLANFEREFNLGLDRVLDDLAPNGAAFADFHERISALANNVTVRSGSTETVAWERAEAVARDYLERPLPHLARDFLAGYWIDVLQRAAVLYAEDSLSWQDTVAVIEDLAWSLTPKSDQDERLQLIGLIPALLARLNRGLDLIDAERTDRRPFFDALIEVHAVVLRAELAPPLPPQILSLPISEESAIDRVNRLQRGDWVEFHLADGNTSRERLTWISPQRGILVFSNHLGQRAIQIAPEDLAEMVQADKAQLIFDQPATASDKNSA